MGQPSIGNSSMLHGNMCHKGLVARRCSVPRRADGGPTPPVPPINYVGALISGVVVWDSKPLRFAKQHGGCSRGIKSPHIRPTQFMTSRLGAPKQLMFALLNIASKAVHSQSDNLPDLGPSNELAGCPDSAQPHVTPLDSMTCVRTHANITDTC